MNKKAKIKERLITLADIDNIVNGLPQEIADNAKRQLRKPLLQAYDSHKSTVIYEGKTETAAEKERVLTWKQKALDLETDAFKDIPHKILYYM